MTIPSRPAPPPPTSSTIQQSQNWGVIRNSNNNTIKLPPPPGSKNFPLNQNTALNSGASISANASSSNQNTTKSITRQFPTAKTRYVPTTNWNGSAFEFNSSNLKSNNSSTGSEIPCSKKRMPPPRPPPPRLQESDGSNTNSVLKKLGPPQSVNVLSNLFGRRNKPNSNTISKKPITSQILPKSTSQLFTTNENNTYQITNTIGTSSSFSKQTNYSSNLFDNNTYSSGSNEVQLISFESPPSSPTFTQKSNSDCVSVDSFSSDSNFSSPNNGNISQPESGFEDDFTGRTTSPPDPWESIGNSVFTDNNNWSGGEFSTSRTNYMSINKLQSSVDTTVVHPLRNKKVVDNIQIENHLCNGKSLLPPIPILAMPTIIKPNKGLAPKPPILTPKPDLSQPGYHERISNSTFVEEPPMPTCPPPPPPSGINYNDVDDCITEDDQPYGIALYAYESDENGDLNFRENEKIYLITKLNNEWFVGRSKSGCEGMFPSNYINIKVPLKDTEKINETTDSTNQSKITSDIINEHKIKVIYNFIADQPEDLTIYENDIVNVLYKINEDWLFGKIDNRQGQFPANFIEYVPPDLPLMMP